MRGIRVKIGMKCFKSMMEAADHFGCHYLTMVKRFKDQGKVIDGFRTLPEFSLNNKKTIAKNTNKNKNCPVLCETTNHRYDTITAAAKAIGVNAWTMGLKMQTAGYFLDKNGNKYIRLRPMNSDKSYSNIHPYITKERNVKKQLKAIINEPSKANNMKETFNTAIESIRKLAINKINEGSYSEASNFIEALSILEK